MMPTPDLPAELWLHILTYLPQGTVRKMIGVSRIVHELSLDDIYKAVHFSSNNERMLNTFQRLESERMARRVHYFHIQPKFFPVSNDGLNQNAFRRKVMLAIGHFRSRTAASLAPPFQMFVQNPTFEVLNIAKESVKRCRAIQELKVTFHDQGITPSFVSFMDSLWAADSVGPYIKKLSMDTTFVKLPLFLKPLVEFSSNLTSLREFDLELCFTWFEFIPARWDQAVQALLSFFTSFKDALTTIAFSSKASYDHGPLFDSFPHIPYLKEFQFLMQVNEETFPHSTGCLTKFLSKHASTLEVLTVRPHSRFITKNLSGDNHYNFWLNDEESTKSERLYSIAQLVFPNLHTFNVGLQSFKIPTGGPYSFPLPLPDFSRAMPNLTKLVITELDLPFQQLSCIVDSLARPDGGSILQEFDYACYELSPLAFDLLSQKLPRLKALTVKYDHTYSAKDGESYLRARLGLTFPEEQSRFNDGMRARKYPSWSLSYLRLLRSPCAFGHPDLHDMKVIAASLTQRVVLDDKFVCNCPSITIGLSPSIYSDSSRYYV